MKRVETLPSLTSEQKKKLDSCVPLPPAADTERGNKLKDCLAVTGEIRQALLVAADAAADAKVAGDSTFKIGEQRVSLHTFWIQAAQLVLLNLLLPLLTALFGYIFGRQQEQKASS